MAKSGLDVDIWESEFLRVRGTFDSFTEELRRLLVHLLKAENVDYAQLEARTKDAKSFRGKLERKGKNYVDPLCDVTDLSGLRIILYYPADVSLVGELIEREFRVDWENSERQGADADPDRFGYRSDHYVVWVSEDRCRNFEWKGFADKRAEIQVRTVMQHAWAAVDHKFRYKTSQVVPRDLRRRLYRLSALLEIADEEFAALQEASVDASSAYADALAHGDLDLPLDALSMRAFVAHVGDEWKARAGAAGWVVVEGDFEPEAVSAVRDSRIEDLLDTSRALGLNTIRELDEWLREAKFWADKALVTLVEKVHEFADQNPMDSAPAGYGALLATRENVLLVLVHIGSGDEQMVRTAGWRVDIAHGIVKAFADVPPLNGASDSE